MKTNIRILAMMAIAAMIIFVEGCKKDDPTPTQAQLLIGSWKEVSFVSSGCTDAADNGSSTCTTQCETLVVSNTTLTIGTESWPYTVVGNTLTFTVGGQKVIVTIAVTKTTLVVIHHFASQLGAECLGH